MLHVLAPIARKWRLNGPDGMYARRCHHNKYHEREQNDIVIERVIPRRFGAENGRLVRFFGLCRARRSGAKSRSVRRMDPILYYYRAWRVHNTCNNNTYGDRHADSVHRVVNFKR